MTTAKRIFAKELSYIQDESVRNFVVWAFNVLCPEYFWVIPASQRGHHPRKCQALGGLVMHTKLAVRFGRSFIELWPDPPGTAHDEVIAALLLHDMFKRGSSFNELKSFDSHEEAKRRHGLFCAERLRWLYKNDSGLRGLIQKDRFRRIVVAVRDHMGKWADGCVQDQINIVSITTHMADYAASRHLDKWLEELEAT